MQKNTDKNELLLQIMREFSKNDIAVAFSGGVDSSLLLKIACSFAGISGKKSICHYHADQAPPGRRDCRRPENM